MKLLSRNGINKHNYYIFAQSLCVFDFFSLLNYFFIFFNINMQFLVFYINNDFFIIFYCLIFGFITFRIKRYMFGYIVLTVIYSGRYIFNRRPSYEPYIAIKGFFVVYEPLLNCILQFIRSI